MSPFRDDMTLAEARDVLRTRVDDGERCPCCTQQAKVYARPIHASMAVGLIKLYRRPHDEFHEIAEFMQHRELADFAKLANWGLVTERPGVRADGSSRTGWWKITPLGVAFVEGRATVHRRARLYDGRCLGLIGEQASIRECLGSKFDYADLMGHEPDLKVEDVRHAVSPSPVVSDGPWSSQGSVQVGALEVGGTHGSSETTAPQSAIYGWDE